MAINLDWSVLNRAPDVGEEFRKGMSWGRDQRRQGVQDNALAALARNPEDPQALQAMAGINPEYAWKMQDRGLTREKAERTEALAKLEANRENITKGAQIARQMKPQDQASWDATLQVAAQAGIDTSNVPREYNPQYIQGLVATADAFEPIKAEASSLQFLTPENGGVFVGDKRSGAVRAAVLPNPGNKPTGAHAAASSLPVVSDQQSYDAIPAGQEFQDPNGNIRRKPGGPTVRPSGTFRP